MARKAIPLAIRPAYAKLYGQAHEAKFSLPAYTPEAEARLKFASWHASIEARFALLRTQAAGVGSDLSHKQAHGLAGQWYRYFVARHEETPKGSTYWALDRELLWDRIRSHLPEQAAPTDLLKARVQAMEEWAAGYWKLDAFLTDNGLTLTPAGREAFLVAASYEIEAAMSLLERRAEGDYTADDRPALHPVFVPPVAAPAPPPVASSGLAKPSDLFRRYVEATQPAKATVKLWGVVFRTLDDTLQDKPIHTLTDEDALAWRNVLRSSKTRSEVSIQRVYVTAARTVWAWACSEKLAASNPFLALKPRKDKRAVTEAERERSFKDEESKLILGAAITDEGGRRYKSARRWVPWLCAYTGARVGEMAQLRKEDVYKFEGTWFAKITPEAGTVKTRRVRHVPLHAHLVEQGFIDFVKAAPAGPLFYTAAPQGPASTDALSPANHAHEPIIASLAEWVRRLGVTDPGLRPNHAWRHTFKRIARAAGIEPGIRDAICGHAARTAGEDYEALEGDEGLRTLAKAIKVFPQYTI